jgi:hypothetical protein
VELREQGIRSSCERTARLMREMALKLLLIYDFMAFGIVW